MPTIVRDNKKTKQYKFPAFGGRLNLWAYKTKTMSEEQQEQLVEDHPEQFPDKIHVLIEYPDGSAVLVDELVQLSAFDTGSIGYTLEIKGATFESPEED